MEKLTKEEILQGLLRGGPMYLKPTAVIRSGTCSLDTHVLDYFIPSHNCQAFLEGTLDFLAQAVEGTVVEEQSHGTIEQRPVEAYLCDLVTGEIYTDSSRALGARQLALKTQIQGGTHPAGGNSFQAPLETIATMVLSDDGMAVQFRRIYRGVGIDANPLGDIAHKLRLDLTEDTHVTYSGKERTHPMKISDVDVFLNETLAALRTASVKFRNSDGNRQTTNVGLRVKDPVNSDRSDSHVNNWECFTENHSAQTLRGKVVELSVTGRPDWYSTSEMPIAYLSIPQEGDVCTFTTVREQRLLLDPSIVTRIAARYNSERTAPSEDTFRSYLTQTVGLSEPVADGVLAQNPLGIVKDKTPSYGTVLHVANASGQKLVLKVHRDGSISAREKAYLEATLNDRFGRHPLLAPFVAGTPVRDILTFGNLALSTQYDISNQRRAYLSPSLNHVLDMHARIAVFGDEALEGVILPVAEAPSPQVLEHLRKRNAKTPELKSMYTDAQHLFAGSYVILTDSKEDNSKGAVLLDLERARRGSLAVPLSLLFAERNLDSEAISHYARVFSDRVAYWGQLAQQPLSLDPRQLAQEVTLTLVPCVLKELGGLYDRGDSRGSYRQLTNYLLAS